MTQAPIKGLIVRMAIPTIISMLVTSIYNMADTFFVGQMHNTSATGAIGIVFPLMAIIQGIGFTFGQGSGNSMSRSLGAQDRESAQRISATGFYSAFFTGILLALFGLVFNSSLMSLLGSTPTILPYAQEYVRLILPGAPWLMASIVLNNQLRLQGSAFFAMIGIGFGALLNIALDPLFIFTFKMGVSGAALATSISQFFSFWILLAATKKGGNIVPKLRNLRIKKEQYAEILRGGLPSFWRQGLGSIASVMLNVAAGTYGDWAIAGMTIVTRTMMFAASAIIGFGQGFQPVCGFSFGAGLYARVRKGFFFTFQVMLIWMLMISVIGIVFAPQIVSLFSQDQAVIQFGSTVLRYHCYVFPLMALLFASNMMLQNINFAFRASFLSMARQGIFFIPAILILPRLFGITGLQAVQPVADVCAFLLTIPVIKPVLHQLKHAEKLNVSLNNQV
ncbi:MAG: MATE family efflux transporter [Clostridiales bacterium]|nr:MATE family efflux transporter [Clostridiales bacterium]